MNSRLFPAETHRQFKNLMRQPLTWAASIAFVVGINLYFFILRNFFNIETGTSDIRFMFIAIPYISILVLPALTITLKTPEGDLSLTYPVSSVQLTASRWLASFCLYLILVVLTVPSILMVSLFGDVHVPQVFTAYSGIILYGAAACSLCTFLCIAFKGRVASFFISAAILLVVSTSHLLPQYVRISSFMSRIMRQISVSWHLDAACKGIADTRDYVFFSVLTFGFIWFGSIKIERQKGRKLLAYSTLAVTAVILTVAAGSMFYKRIDLTEGKKFSLSDQGKNILSEAASTLDITYYLSPELESLYPQVQDVKDYLNSLTVESRYVNLLTVNPSGLEADELSRLSELGILSQQLETTEDNRTSYINVYSSILMEYGGNAAVIPFVISTSSLEYSLMTRLRAIITGSTRTVLLLSGNGLSIANDYSYVMPWLQSAGFLCREIAAEELYEIKDFENCQLLVLGSSDITLEQAVAIEEWVLQGGKALFAVSRNKTDFNDFSTVSNDTDILADMIDMWGIGTDSGICMDPECYRITVHYASGLESDYVSYRYWPLLKSLGDGELSDITAGFNEMTSFWSSPLYYSDNSNLKITPLLKTSAKAWLSFPDDEGNYVTDPFLSETLEADKKTVGQYAIAVAGEGAVQGCYSPQRGKDTRLIVIGDQYFVSNMVAKTNTFYSNLDFLQSAALWLSGDEDFLNLKNKRQENTSLYKITDTVEISKKSRFVIGITMILIPVILVIMYILVYIFRRNRDLTYLRQG